MVLDRCAHVLISMQLLSISVPKYPELFPFFMHSLAVIQPLKKSAWQAWKTYCSITDVFEEMSQKPFSLIEKDSTNFQKIQKFVIQIYSSNLETASVDEARMLLFAQNQNMERIPPTCDALLHHAK
jgi:hypothetical protein